MILGHQLQSLLSSHAAVQAENQTLRQEKQQLQNRHDALLAENQKLREEMQQLQNKHDAVLAEHQKLQQEQQELGTNQRSEEIIPQVPFSQLTGAWRAVFIKLSKYFCLFFISNQQQVPHQGWKIDLCLILLVFILSFLVILWIFILLHIFCKVHWLLPEVHYLL